MKSKKLFLLIFSFLFVTIILAQSVYANLLAECGNCHATGKCSECGGANIITCDKCKGSGEMTCDNCFGNSHVTCHICNGTLETNGQLCSACENGKEICSACQNGIMRCTGCNGSGKMTCTGCYGGGNCLQCKGTGYVDGQTNGITNIPKNGDTVEKLDGTFFIWGGATSNTNNSNKSNTNTANKSNSTNNSQKVEQQPTNEEETTNTPEIINDSIATGTINSINMEEQQLEKYNSLSEEQKAEVIDKVNKIVSTANTNVDNMTEDTRKSIDKILENNNINSDKDIKLRTISFEGHLSLDFPVSVTVNIDKEIYGVSDIIHAYHILEDGTVEYLGEAKKELEEDLVVGVTFETSGFSEFFLTTVFLNIENNFEDNSEDTSENDSEEQKEIIEETKNYNYYFIAYVIISMIIIITETIYIIKNRKNKGKKI